MMPVTSTKIVPSEQDYCSQERAPLPPIKTIEEGVRIIEKILAKEVLCKHDVEDLNQAYQAIDLLERRVEQIPEINSLYVLKKIVEKVQRISNNNISPSDLISLYHLRNFSDMSIEDFCKKTIVKFEKNKDYILELASNLPCCTSANLFNDDIVFLVGSGHDDRVGKTLERKKQKLQIHENTKHLISVKKSEYAHRGTIQPENYPGYLDDLLKGGYVRLCEHIVEMKSLPNRNERKRKMEEMTYSELSHVILEVRKAIIQKVESSIPVGHKSVVFLVGGTRAGKSTTLCYLRGDVMMKFEGDKYLSKSDQAKLIGHSGKTSCTFLPTVEVVNGFIFVDFPGFDDTNSTLISLGMEFALKALIKKYQPKILVLESIMNNDTAYRAPAELGERLDRIVENRKSCVLGMTKYSLEFNSLEIKKIEDKQREERLNSLFQQEKDLQTELATAKKYRAPESDLQDIQQKLAKIQEEKAQLCLQPLPDTAEKAEHRKRIEEKEAEFLSQIGLGSILKFSDLENSTYLHTCFTKFSNMENIQGKSEQILNEVDEKVLDKRFNEQLIKEIERKDDLYDKSVDVKNFEESVLGSSLIKTIFAHSNPEIGELLHLPEINSKIVRGYDIQIVESCIKKCIDAIIQGVDIWDLRALINSIRAAAPNPELKSRKDLEKSLNELLVFVVGLEAESPNITKEQIEKAWVRIKERHKKIASDEVEGKYVLPFWLKIFGIPILINSLVKQNAQDRLTGELLEQNIHNACNELDNMLNILTTLKGIEKLIKKQDQINKTFENMEISLSAIDDFELSFMKKIGAIKAIYNGNDEKDKDDWDKRVIFLKRKFFQGIYPLANTNYLALISQILDDKIICVKNINGVPNEMLQEELTPCLFLGPGTMLTNGKLSAALFIIEMNRLSGKKVAEIDEKLSIDERMLQNIARFKAEMDMKKPLYRTLLAAILLEIYNDQKK